MAQIGELSVSQLTKHATNTFIFWGRQETGTRLAYHALALNLTHPEGLARLSDFLDIEGAQPLSAVVLEYGCSQQAGLPPDDKAMLEELRFHALWSWGFYRHRSGRTVLSDDDFADRSQFVLDANRYQSFLETVLGRCVSLEHGFRAAHTFAGVLSGLLVHRELADQATFDVIYHPDRFERTQEYPAWLASPTDELDALEH
jgi:hypothetical protein